MLTRSNVIFRCCRAFTVPGRVILLPFIADEYIITSNPLNATSIVKFDNFADAIVEAC